MPCYKPVTAWKPLEGGAIHFSEKKNCVEIQIKCGQCIGCRIAKREAWAIRCYAESKLHENNHFITLTYSDDKLPQYNSLTYRDWQLFAKRLRSRVGPFRFFMCGEYGDNTNRPHYHALLFGLRLDDLRRYSSVYARDTLYESPTINDLWGKGQVTIGEVTYESSRYCAVYTTKKMSGDLWSQSAESQYIDPLSGECFERLQPFAHMSLKPGIGLEWLKLYWRDIFVSGANGVAVNGQIKPIPRYFIDKMDDIAYKLMDDWEFDQYQKVNKENNTRERLEVREAVAKSKQRFNSERNISHAL